jgi:serpin B
MRKSKCTLIVCLLLIAALALNMTACVSKVHAADLMDGVNPTAANAAPTNPTADQQAAAADFALRLFRASNESGRNTLISPLSVSIALSMTANGARGETLAQMEQTLGMSLDELNAYYLAYRQELENSEVLRLANSIWFTNRDHFTVNRDFLQTNADYYGADAYQAPFDEATLKDINNWVKDKTKGMIPEILDRIPEDAVMYLVNALAFECKWAEEYEEDQIYSGEFTCADGSTRTVDFLHSEESEYLETEQATGFIKPYKDSRYAFAALLPKEGVSLEQLLDGLDGAALRNLLQNPVQEDVSVSIPKFETSYDTELSKALTDMGMELPFQDGADFTGLGKADDGICISRILHKTFLSVDETGTKAAAATVVEMTKSAVEDIIFHSVYLNRPFVYMVIDRETNLPLFIGTMLDPAK